MKNNKKIWCFGFFVVAVAMAVGMVVDHILPDVFVNLLGGDVLTAFAFVGAAAADTAQGTVSASSIDPETDEVTKPKVDKASFSKKLTKIFPSKFPMDTIARELPKGKTDSDEYKYASVVARGIGCTVASTTTKGGNGALVEITMNSVHMLSVDSNLMVNNYLAVGPDVEPTLISKTDAISPSPLILHIVRIDRANNKAVVFAVNAPYVPVINANQFLPRVGVAKDQMVAMSEDPISMPTYDSNYCQINMATISEAYFQKIQEKEVEWGMADMQESAIFDFRGQSEMAMLFGAKRAFRDPETGRAKYMMDGFIRKVGNTINHEGAGITDKTLNADLAKIFDGNNGSDARLMFYGSDFGLMLENSATFQKQLEAGKTKVKFGITWNEIETNQGTILAKKHDAFNQVGYGRAALVIDPANFRRIEQRPLTVYDLDLEKAGKQRTQDRRIDESFTLEVTNPETHGLILG